MKLLPVHVGGFLLTLAVVLNAEADPPPTHVILVTELHGINSRLAQANPVYKGHRAIAMDHIHKAITRLEKHAKIQTKAKKPPENKKTNLPQAVSDAVLIQAVKDLAVVQAQISTLEKIPPHVNSAGDIRAAITELEKALTVK